MYPTHPMTLSNSPNKLLCAAYFGGRTNCNCVSFFVDNHEPPIVITSYTPKRVRSLLGRRSQYMQVHENWAQDRGCLDTGGCYVFLQFYLIIAKSLFNPSDLPICIFIMLLKGSCIELARTKISILIPSNGASTTSRLCCKPTHLYTATVHIICILE